MPEPVQHSRLAWRPADHRSRLVLDVAAGRKVGEAARLGHEELLLLSRHGLLGLAATSSAESLRLAARPLYARLLARQKVMVDVLSSLLGELAARQVPVAILKGPYLAEAAYRRPEQRTFTDIDLLVPRRALDRALAVLAAHPTARPLPPQAPKGDKRNVPFADPSGVRFDVDLHWDLFSYSQLLGEAEGATDWAWREARGPEEGPLGPIWQLPQPAHLGFLCTHALLDHRFRLILFRDLAEIAAGRVDWPELVGFVERWGLRSTTYLALLIAARAVGAAVPEWVLAGLRPHSVVMRAAERLLERTDLVRFEGHRLAALNLAIVLQHDRPWGRLRLAARAPFALPGWRRRVDSGLASRG
ncbi:MAG: nucleotidyltransferase family protein [Acidimicrobiia bacterium]